MLRHNELFLKRYYNNIQCQSVPVVDVVKQYLEYVLIGTETVHT